MVKNSTSSLALKFPMGFCTPTKKLNQIGVKRILELLKIEGYNLVKFDRCDYLNYDYLGVNTYGDIMFYSNPDSYLPINCTAGRDNVLSSFWVEEYTSQI